MAYFLKLLNRHHKAANIKFMRFSSSVQNQSTNSEDFLKYDTDPSAQFMRRDNRVLLRSLTHMQINKVFQPHQVPFNRNSYQFLTVAELKTKFEGALRAARRMLLMPPIIPIESDAIEVISKDPALQGFTENKFVFTDTSFNLNDKERTIIVRQPNGVLETADPVTRRRMNQIYFPREGRKLAIPRMFNGEHLQRTLDEGKYIFVLNRAAIQFEPYDKDYHRVTSVTYQHINDHSAFECLRSTRHFGPFAFFLAWHLLIDALLIDCIRRDYLRNAVEAICLMYNIHNLPYDGYILEQLKRYPNRDDEYYYRKLIEGNDKENENDKSNEIQFEIEKTVGKNSDDLQVDELCLNFIDEYIQSDNIVKRNEIKAAVHTYREESDEKKRLMEGLQKAHGIN